MRQYGQVVVSESTPDGYVTYIKVNGEPVSPKLPNLADLMGWMKNNGWYWAEGETEKFYPWRVANLTNLENKPA